MDVPFVTPQICCRLRHLVSEVGQSPVNIQAIHPYSTWWLNADPGTFHDSGGACNVTVA